MCVSCCATTAWYAGWFQRFDSDAVRRESVASLPSISAHRLADDRGSIGQHLGPILRNVVASRIAITAFAPRSATSRSIGSNASPRARSHSCANRLILPLISICNAAPILLTSRSFQPLPEHAMQVRTLVQQTDKQAECAQAPRYLETTQALVLQPENVGARRKPWLRS